MYPVALLAGLAVLLVSLLGAAVLIVCLPALRLQRPADVAPQAPFSTLFAGELADLNDAQPPAHPVQQSDAYALHMQGEPSFRIASALGIPRADAELLIRIQDSLRGNLPDSRER